MSTPGKDASDFLGRWVDSSERIPAGMCEARHKYLSELIREAEDRGARCAAASFATRYMGLPSDCRAYVDMMVNWRTEDIPVEILRNIPSPRGAR